jgi:hypothetical protein
VLVFLAACASPSSITGAVPSTSGLTPAEALPVLQEVNRHIETCDRTYAWPFAVTIVCKAQGQPATTATQPLTAADIQAMITSAVAKALSAAPASPGK